MKATYTTKEHYRMKPMYRGEIKNGVPDKLGEPRNWVCVATFAYRPDGDCWFRGVRTGYGIRLVRISDNEIMDEMSGEFDTLPAT